MLPLPPPPRLIVVIEALFADSRYRHARWFRFAVAAPLAYGHFAFDNDTRSELEADLNLRNARAITANVFMARTYVRNVRIKKREGKSYIIKPVENVGRNERTSLSRMCILATC